MNKTAQLAIIVVIAALGYGAWHYQDQLPFIGGGNGEAQATKGPARPPQNVIVSAVVSRALPRTITAIGTARANESVVITSKVTGKINTLDFNEGQKVKVGKLLVQLDDTELRANLTESEAARDNSQKLYDRALKLYATRNVAKAQVDLLLSELQATEAAVSAGKARLSDYRIAAPFSGVLGFREVSVGSLVQPGDVITTLDDTDTIKVDFDLPETYIADVGPGLNFSAKNVAYRDRLFKGEVDTISTRVNEFTRAVRVRGSVPNEDGLLKPGMFLSVELQISVDENALLISEEAVVLTISGPIVYAVSDGKAVRTPVKIGRRIRGFAEVIEGLDEGDQVITEGLQKVKDGAPVNPSASVSTSEAS
ncbi:efflux RND transporter periplasmic adaptor subunit [Sneathiella sp.]|uniref:efflux RND transporter periplasmic adaptor subunit n=1 Tax=Sneathiella sp. TaxID=1964365 RepID=UPI0026119C69|nr:efflux RND transporter periplasmic adaptor subunit [Sneathiella sp.]MDF2366785.1 efflux RND transporter periplasmic adaptor subunit [Sneathiella sp.]